MNTLLQMGLSNALMATFLAVLAAALGRVCRPALRHGLWLLVLLKLITPSFVACPLPWPDGPKPTPEALSGAAAIETPAAREENAECRQTDEVAAELPVGPLLPFATSRSAEVAQIQPKMDALQGSTAAIVNRSNPDSASGPAFSLSGAIATFWLAGSIGWFGFVTYRIYRFRRLLRCALPSSAQLAEQVQRLAERLGLAACPTVWLLPGRLSPMVWALGGQPRLVVSSALWERLTSEQQTTLLLHELAHLRRRDHLVRGLELLVTSLYWWHPIVWWASRELREAEEQCCDAWVVWCLPRAARAYATALLETIDFLSETQNALPAVASGIGHVHDLRRRLTMIMHGTTPRALSGAGLLVVLGLGAFLLPLRPTWGQVEKSRIRHATPEADERPRAEEPALAQVEDARPRESQPRQELRGRLDAERHQFMAERQALTAQVQTMKANLERAMSELKRAEERLAELQDRERRAAREAVPQGIVTTPQQAPRTRSLGRQQESNPERRLADLEKKLDELLEEVQGMRREMRRSGSGMMRGPNPGMPGMMAPLPPSARPSTRPGREPSSPPATLAAPAAAPPAGALPPPPAPRPGRTVAPPAPVHPEVPAPPLVPPTPSGAGSAPSAESNSELPRLEAPASIGR